MPNPTVGDTRILNGRAVIPIQLPLIPQLQSRLGARRKRLFGEGTIISRKYGSGSLWADTPLEKSPAVGDVNVYTLDDVLARWDDVGFNWNFKENRLEAYLTTKGQTYKVLVPASKIKAIFEGVSERLGMKQGCLCKHKGGLESMLKTIASWLEAVPKVGAPFGYQGSAVTAAIKQGVAAGKIAHQMRDSARSTMSQAQLAADDKKMDAARAQGAKNRASAKSKIAWAKKCSGGFDLECFISDVGKEIDTAVTNVTKGVESFFNDPVKWVEGAARDIGKFVDEVGMVALDVVSSPIFTGIAAALSVIPPLCAVGAAGLAASAAANAIKPAVAAIKAGANIVKDVAGAAQDPGKLVKMAAGAAGVSPATLNSAQNMVDSFKEGVVKLPKPAQSLVVAALQSTPGPKPPAPIVAQVTPQGIQAAVYAPTAMETKTIKAAIYALPSNIQTLWQKALQTLPETQRIILGYALNEPLNGRSAGDVIFSAPERNHLRLALYAIKGLKSNSAQLQLGTALRRAYA